MYKSISKDIQSQTLTRLKEGKEKISVIAEQHCISAKTIYTWLSKGIDGGKSGWLENNRLKKENLQLKQMVGELMLEKNERKN